MSLQSAEKKLLIVVSDQFLASFFRCLLDDLLENMDYAATVIRFVESSKNRKFDIAIKIRNLINKMEYFYFLRVAKIPTILKINNPYLKKLHIKNFPRILQQDFQNYLHGNVPNIIINLTGLPLEKLLLDKDINSVIISPFNHTNQNSDLQNYATNDVIFQRDSTNFAIEICDLENRKISLILGRFMTQKYMALNQMRFMEYVKYYLRNYIDSPNFLKERNSKESNTDDSRAISVILLTKYIAFNLIEKFVHLYHSITNTNSDWHVFIAKKSKSLDDYSLPLKIRNPKGAYLADPFIITIDGKTVVFAENYNRSTNKGSIVFFRIESNSIGKIETAIEEDFHLSFPFIFQHNEKIYMCPETSEKREIRLYECLRFPDLWQFKETLIHNINAVDTIIFELNNLFWIICNVDAVGNKDFNTEMRIYYSKDLLGSSWNAHSGNPVYLDSKKSRNGGFLSNNKMPLRVNQVQGLNFYGKNFEVNEILQLDKDNFLESEISYPLPNSIVQKLGKHHLNDNEEYIVFDMITKI